MSGVDKSGPLALERARSEFATAPRRWLVTGSAGFIGSHLVEALLGLGQTVVGLDDFSTGYHANLDEVRDAVGAAAWRRHTLVEGDVADPAVCARVLEGVDVVLHQAALGSVPRSIADPLATHRVNATGFLNLLVAARDAGVSRFVYAASSSTYGDHPGLPKVEHEIGTPLSPYAVTKYVNELYAGVFSSLFEIAAIGLRYFNVFGPRQDPEGAYAAVIPRWAAAMFDRRPITIYGDGDTTRDFCYVDNVVQANLLAASSHGTGAAGDVFNVAVGGRMSLNELHAAMARQVRQLHPGLTVPPPRYEPFRIGDVRHSQADIGKARARLGFEPGHDVEAGLAAALPWYEARHLRDRAPRAQALRA